MRHIPPLSGLRDLDKRRAELGRVLINLMRRPTSVIGGEADMARTCQYVR